MIKKIVWKKIKPGVYSQINDNNNVLEALAIFLNDGLTYKTYVDFLNNENEKKFIGNLSWLEKNGEMVSIEIDDYVYPETLPLIMPISNLLVILEEYRKLISMDIEIIEILLDDTGQILIEGS